MAQGTANLRAIPGVLAEALQATLALNPTSEGQKIAQRRIEIALETALDARRQRIRRGSPWRPSISGHPQGRRRTAGRRQAANRGCVS